jgi:hypothetical protein
LHSTPHPRALSPEDEARLRDPRHPVHHGFRMHPVPNLIVTRGPRPHVAERFLRMSPWMRKHIVWVHYTPLQKFLIWTGGVAMVVMVAVAPFLVLP